MSPAIASSVPVLLGHGFLRFCILRQSLGFSKKAYESSAHYACEDTLATRGAPSLTREGNVLKQLTSQAAISPKSTLRSSTHYAASQLIALLVEALGFWYSGLPFSSSFQLHPINPVEP